MPDPLRISEIGQRGVVRLRSLSLTPPANDRTSLVPPGLGGQARLLTLAPGEWWVTSEVLTGPQVCESLREHLKGRDTAAVDLSCALKVIRIEGTATRDLLAKGCGLDFHPRYFPAGFATRTRFAQLTVALECLDTSPRFELYVGRSHFAWLKSWLDDTAVEFGHATD